MKTEFFIKLLVMVLSALILTSASALAHERRDVSKYQFVVGFIVEPPFEGQKNSVDLRVTNKETTKPVEGLEKTIQVEVTHVPSNTSRIFPLRTIFQDPGHYTNDLFLTAPGQYRLRFFGAIEGFTVNETFESGPGRFNDVQSSAEIQFPQKVREVREIEAAVRGAQNAAQEARDSAANARAVAFVGIGLGVLGIAAGAWSMASRKR